MQGRQKQVIEAIERVQDFTEANPLPPPLSYGGPKELLDEVVATLNDHSTDQVAGGRMSKAERQREARLRNTLREQHLRPISLIARASLRSKPGIDKALRMPRPNLATTRLIAESNAVRESVAPHEADFVANGRPADFLARLDEAIETLRQAMLGKARNLGRQVGAGKGLADTIRQGRDTIKLLDAIVSTSFAGNAEVLGRWRMAKRIRTIPGGGAPTVPATGGTADENVEPKAA